MEDLSHSKGQEAKLTLLRMIMKPKIPSGTRLINKQVGMIRTMEKESRKEKAVKEKPKEKVIKVTSPLATRARRKVPLRLLGKRSMVPRARVKARLTSVQKPRMERLLPQRRIVHHGMTNLKITIRNFGTAVEIPAGSPKTVKTGINGLRRGTAPSS